MKLKVVAVVALAAVGVGAVVFAFGGIGAKAASATQYLTATATRGDVTDEVAATGTLAAASSYGLVFGADPYPVTSTSTAPASDTTWPVAKVNVRIGDTVAKGDVLATANTASLKVDLASAKNTLRSANIGLLAAKTELSDAETAGVLARTRQAKIGLANATNQVTSARRDVAAIQAKLQRASLVAPVAGIVTEVNVTAGADAPTGVAIVVAASTFTITTDVVERDVAHIQVGQKATVTITALGQQVSGTVSAISPVASSSSTSSGGVVSFPVTIALTGAPANARSGMSADVTVTTASATGVITVPSAALRGNTGNYSVLTLAADGTTTSTPVEVGLVTNSLAEIKSGLAEGAVVVTGTAADLAGTSNGNALGAGGIAIPGGGGAFPRQIRNGNGGGTTTTGGG